MHEQVLVSVIRSAVFELHDCPLFLPAGKTTTDEELDEMLEGGNSAVFTAGVSLHACARMGTQTPAANQHLWSEARTLSGLLSAEAVTAVYKPGTIIIVLLVCF